MDALPAHIEQVLANSGQLEELAREWAAAGYIMFFGRHVGLPIALEGALKMKEISYVHAEGFPSGEMKHGPIALIEDGGPVVALVTSGHVRSKVVSNIEQVKGRGAVVLAIATEGDAAIKQHADHVVYVPEVHELLYPVLTVVPLAAPQLPPRRRPGPRRGHAPQPRKDRHRRVAACWSCSRRSRCGRWTPVPSRVAWRLRR